MPRPHRKGYRTCTCVICGKRYRVYDRPGIGKTHRCPKAVLAGIAAAERLADNIDDFTMPHIPAHLDDRLRPYGYRLAVGFAMLRGVA